MALDKEEVKVTGDDRVFQLLVRRIADDDPRTIMIVFLLEAGSKSHARSNHRVIIPLPSAHVAGNHRVGVNTRAYLNRGFARSLPSGSELIEAS